MTVSSGPTRARPRVARAAVALARRPRRRRLAPVLLAHEVPGRKPEVIRATMLEDSPCLPCGLCCTLLAHEVPGSGAGHGCHLAVADDHRPAHLAVGLFEVSLGPRANTKYDLD